MNNDIKFQKILLGPDWIDLSYGEPKVITRALYKQLNRFGSKFTMPTPESINKWEYQPAAGNIEFVKFLEEKYSAKVVVCNGAKQALAASLYALTRVGVKEIYYSDPHYPANPILSRMVGMSRSPDPSADAILITSPNNPDGHNLTNEEIVSLSIERYAIHDAAYYTRVYLPQSQKPINAGDLQIYSLSKTYGLSGLRIGYVLCHNKLLYPHVKDYVEMMTAGVSAASQEVAFSVERFFHENPKYFDDFCEDAINSLTSSREMLSKLDPNVLDVIPSNCNSMFAWAKVGPKFNMNAAKVNMLGGELFGQPGMMRMNIAYPAEVIAEAVERLNKYKI